MRSEPGSRAGMMLDTRSGPTLLAAGIGLVWPKPLISME
jgi:hypothetical protein